MLLEVQLQTLLAGLQMWGFTPSDRPFRQHKHWDWKPVEPLIKSWSQILSCHYTFPLTDSPMGHWSHSSETGSTQFIRYDDMFYFLPFPTCSVGLFHGSMITSTVWNCLVSSLGIKKVHFQQCTIEILLFSSSPVQAQAPIPIVPWQSSCVWTVDICTVQLIDSAPTH